MKKSALSFVFVLAAFGLTACDQESKAPQTFTSAQVLATQYDIALGEGVSANLNYRSGSPLVTSHTISWADYLGGMAPDYKKLDVDFDSTHQVFVVHILDSTDAIAGSFFVPADRVTVTLKNGTVLQQFANSLTDIVSIDLSIEASPVSVTTVGNCEVRTARQFNVSITSDSMELSVKGEKRWVDIVGNMPGALDSCSDRLNQEKSYLEIMSPMADADLEVLKEKNFIDMARLTQLSFLDVSIVLAATAPEASMSSEFGSDASVAPAADLVTVDLGGGVSAQVADPTRAALL